MRPHIYTSNLMSPKSTGSRVLHAWARRPSASGYSAQPVLDYVADAAADAANRSHGAPLPLRPLECTQEAGDVMYVPWSWGHGTLNLGEVQGMATEFDFCPWHTVRRIVK